MIFGQSPSRYVVQRIAGPQTSIGPQSIRSSTATGVGSLSTLYPNGTIS
jgi:hypothetical protein